MFCEGQWFGSYQSIFEPGQLLYLKQTHYVFLLTSDLRDKEIIFKLLFRRYSRGFFFIFKFGSQLKSNQIFSLKLDEMEVQRAKNNQYNLEEQDRRFLYYIFGCIVNNFDMRIDKLTNEIEQKYQKEIHAYKDILFMTKEALWSAKESLFNRWFWNNWIIMRKRKPDPYLMPCMNIHYRCIIDLNVKGDTIKLLEDNIGEELQDFKGGKTN